MTKNQTVSAEQNYKLSEIAEMKAGIKENGINNELKTVISGILHAAKDHPWPPKSTCYTYG